MFLKKDHVEDQHKKINELEIEIARLDALVDELYQDIDVQPEQIDTLLSNSNNFSPKNWEQIQEQQREIDDNIKREISNIVNPKHTQKKYEDRHVSRDWLFVR